MPYLCKKLPALTSPADVAKNLEIAEKNGWTLVAMTYVPGTPAGDVVLYAFHGSAGASPPALGSFHD